MTFLHEVLQWFGIHEKNQHHFFIKDITVVTKILWGNKNICDSSFCDAITNIYYYMVLKVFIPTIAKPAVKWWCFILAGL